MCICMHTYTHAHTRTHTHMYATHGAHMYMYVNVHMLPYAHTLNHAQTVCMPILMIIHVIYHYNCTIKYYKHKYYL